jgi:hypothetical protein
MRFSKRFENHIKIKSRLYLHCQACNGLFLRVEPPTTNSEFAIVNCIHCGHRLRLTNSENEIEITGAVSRFAAVVRREPSLHKALMFIRGHKKGVSKKVLLRISGEKSICQLLHLGLIAETDNGEAFYHLTIKGSNVLDACSFRSLVGKHIIL